eukprot:959444_1
MAPADKSASKTPAIMPRFYAPQLLLPYAVRKKMSEKDLQQPAIAAVGGGGGRRRKRGFGRETDGIDDDDDNSGGRRQPEASAGVAVKAAIAVSLVVDGDSHGIGGGIIGADADAVVRGGRHERRSTTGMTRREPAGAGEAKRRRILFFLLGSESSAEEGLTGQRQPC